MAKSKALTGSTVKGLTCETAGKIDCQECKSFQL